MAAIATVSGVAIIAGCSESAVTAGVLTLADTHVKLLLNRDFDSIKDSEYFIDIHNRNDFVDEYDRVRDFVVPYRPVTEFTSVVSNPDDSSPELLVVNEDYTINLVDGSIKISDNFDVLIQPRSLKVTYKYGYSDAPDEVISYANFYASYLLETIPSLAKNTDGAILREVEIGRYREAYGDSGKLLETKYTKFLNELKDLIVQKYKIWD